MEKRFLIALVLVVLLQVSAGVARGTLDVQAQEPEPTSTPWADPIDQLPILPLEADIYRLDLGYADLLIIQGRWGSCAILAQYGEDPLACQFAERDYIFAPRQATPGR